MKYSPDGGMVRVRIERRGEMVAVEVKDQGIGVPAAALPNLFKRYYRAGNVDRNITGLGVGLFVVNEIVTLHGGAVEVESMEGQGSTFTVLLPLHEQAATGV
jgi:signal transduction histidine kinase